MAKIWLKIWLKVKENGTKKNQIGENGGERKRNPSANPDSFQITQMQLHLATYTGPENKYYVLKILISSITRYYLINCHYVYRVCMPDVVIQQVRCN